MPIWTYSKNMVKKKLEAEAYECPACKQSVPVVLHRHKTLGVFVAVPGPGTCQNRDCPDYRLDPKHKHPPARY